jgi:hypothetical protein
MFVLGCEPPKPAGNAPGTPPPPPPPVESQVTGVDHGGENRYREAPPPVEARVGAFAGGIDELAARPATPPSPPDATAPAPAADPNTETVKAEKGVGIKGRSLDQHSGLLVEPAKAYFAVRERAVFDIQIPHAMGLFKASEGRAPQSHAEFMEKIVQSNQIKLPQLPQGHEYVYDVQAEQLMVKRPKPQ